MKEKYLGPKFKTILEKKNIPYNKKIEELIFWCKKFDEVVLAPHHKKGSYGNLSFKNDNGFIITGSGKDMSKININEFVKVKKCDLKNKKVYARGLIEPSSESFLHWLIYQKRKDVKAIFHGHNQKILEKADELNLIKTEKEKPYGTIELVKEVLKVLNKNNYIIMKNHGFISLGSSMKEAGKIAIKIYKRASKYGRN